MSNVLIMAQQFSINFRMRILMLTTYTQMGMPNPAVQLYSIHYFGGRSRFSLKSVRPLWG